MNKDVYFNKNNEIVSQRYDGKNHYEQVVFDSHQVSAIELIIQKYNEQAAHQS